jgi:hypothetical protein
LKFIKPLGFTLTKRFSNNAKNTTTLACGLGDFSATKANKKLICHINGISNNKNYSKFNDSCTIGMKFMKTFFSLLFFFPLGGGGGGGGIHGNTLVLPC